MENCLAFAECEFPDAAPSAVEVHCADLYREPRFAELDALIAAREEKRGRNKPPRPLTPREQQVAAMASADATDEKIGEALRVPASFVSLYLVRVCQALGIRGDGDKRELLAGHRRSAEEQV